MAEEHNLLNEMAVQLTEDDRVRILPPDLEENTQEIMQQVYIVIIACIHCNV